MPQNLKKINELDNFIESLSNLKTSLRYFDKQPHYRERYKSDIRKTNITYKRLRGLLIKIRKKELKNIIKQLDDFIQKISSENLDSGKKLSIIEKFEQEGIDEDIKLVFEEVSSLPLSQDLNKKLNKKFKKEINGLKLVYGKDGDCTAFLLRKILEKMIYLSFANNEMIDKLKNPSDSSKFVGLEKMINIASATNAKDGTPFLLPKTAKKLGGIKFLGDTAVHNFLADVYPKQIQLEINFIITALEELSKKL